MLVAFQLCAAATTLTGSESAHARAASYYVDTTKRPMGPVALVGDSLTIGYWSDIPRRMSDVGWGPMQFEARSGRRSLVSMTGTTSGIEGIRHIRSSGFNPPVWIIALGTNDIRWTTQTPTGAEALIDAMLNEIGPGHRVAWVNVYYRFNISGSVRFNDALVRVAARRPMLSVIDWYSAVRANPSWLYTDGVHANITGSIARNKLVATGALAARGAKQHTAPRPTLVSAGVASALDPLPPRRVYSTVASRSPLAANETRRIDLTSLVPSGTTGVSLNVTAIGRGLPGHVVAWNCAGNAPGAVGLHYPANGTRSTATVVPLGANRELCLRSPRAVDVHLDLHGTLSPNGGAGYVPAAARVLDTLVLPRQKPLAAGEIVRLALPKPNGAIPNGVAATFTAHRASADATVSVVACSASPPPPPPPTTTVPTTAAPTTGAQTTSAPSTAAPTSDSALTTVPASTDPPTTSPPTAAVATAMPGTTAPVTTSPPTTTPPPPPPPPALPILTVTPNTVAVNTVWLDADADGTVCIRSSGTADLLVDVAGVFVQNTGWLFQLANPQRIIDTRLGVGGWTGMPNAGQPISWPISNAPIAAKALVTNLTATRSLATGAIQTLTCATARPTATVLRFAAATTNGITTIVQPALCLASTAPSHLVVDLVGWFVARPSP